MKKYIHHIMTLIAGMLIMSCGEQNSSNETTTVYADMVLTGGKIITVEKDMPRAEAVAIAGDKIIAVGSSLEIAKHIGENTEIINLNGKTAIPGFIEGHGHYTSFGDSMIRLELRYAKGFDEIIELVSEAAKSTAKGEWIIGRGWHQDKWETPPSPSVEGLPLHNALSAVSPDNPVMLIHTSGHGVFVNKAALDLIGMTNDTVPPEGGEIVRDENGNATGMLREAAQDVARKAYADYQAKRSPALIEAEMRRAIIMAGEESLRHGITSFQDLGTNFYEVDLLKKMADEGTIPVRLWMAFEEQAADMDGKLDQYRMINYGNNFLTVRAIGEKVLDGALGTHGAWLHEPYNDMPRSHGLNVVPIEEIEYSARLAMKHGYQLAIQGIFACSDGPWVEERLGKERTLERGYIFNTLYEAGLTPTNGTDPPVDEISPIGSFYCSVTRILPDGSKFLPNEVYSREVALYSYTMGNAIAAFEEDIKGSLKPGKLADIAILSQDLLTVPDEKIMETEILMTIVGGKIVFKK